MISEGWKTTEEMFQYAKNIADNDECARVWFFVKDWEAVTKLPDIYTHRQYREYRNKGVLRVSTLPMCWEDAAGSFSGSQMTHVFITEFPRHDVYGLLKSRVRTAAKIIGTIILFRCSFFITFAPFVYYLINTIIHSTEYVNHKSTQNIPIPR
jgi:hypothetical protein